MKTVTLTKKQQNILLGLINGERNDIIRQMGGWRTARQNNQVWGKAKGVEACDKQIAIREKKQRVLVDLRAIIES